MHVCSAGIWKWKWEDLEFKVIFSYASLSNMETLAQNKGKKSRIMTDRQKEVVLLVKSNSAAICSADPFLALSQ